MHSASDVAKWFLAHNQVMVDSGGAEYISNLKLQKLLYYAQGAFLVFMDAPLFDDPIEAWTHGPVVPTVYREYKRFKDKGICLKNGFELPSFSEAENELLLEVYNEFGQYSAWKLRNMTHQETPWKNTPIGEVIPLGLIKSYFKQNYVA